MWIDHEETKKEGGGTGSDQVAGGKRNRSGSGSSDEGNDEAGTRPLRTPKSRRAFEKRPHRAPINGWFIKIY